MENDGSRNVRSPVLAQCVSRPAAVWLVVVAIAVAKPPEALAQDDKPLQGLPALLANRPALNIERLQERLNRLDDLSSSDLQAELRTMERAHTIGRENWNRLQTARRIRGLVIQSVAARAGHMTVRLWQTARERETKIKDIRRREEEAFVKRYGIHVIFDRSSPIWQQTPDARHAREEEDEVNNWFIERTNAIAQEAREGNRANETALDREQADIVREYTWTAHAVRTVRQAIEERQRRELAKQGEEKRRYALQFVPTKTDYELETGELAQVWFNTFRGNPPYEITVQSPVAGEQKKHQESPGFSSFSFRFDKPGTYTASASVVDEDGTSRQATIRFKVKEAEEEDKEKEKKKKDEKKPSSKQKPGDDDSKKDTKQTEVTGPLVGTFNAHFYTASGLLGLAEQRTLTAPEFLPLPLSITISSAGQISGKCDYAVPPQKFTQKSIGPWPVVKQYWRTSFRIEGSVDQTSQNIELRFRNGRTEFGNDYLYGTNQKLQRSARAIEFEASWRGVHTASEPAQKYLESMSTLPPSVAERFVKLDYMKPVLEQSADGVFRFRSIGWFHAAGVIEQDPSPIKLTKYEVTNGAVERDLSTHDQTASLRKTYGSAARRAFWCLQLIERTSDLDEPAPDAPEGFLIATGMWPAEEIKMRVGQAQTFQFIGVYDENPSEVVDLGRRAIWQASPGLVQTGLGTYRATAPGTYRVRATIRRRNGELMNGTAIFRVLPAE